MTRQGAKDLAVVLQDLAWLLPRTIGAAELEREALPLSELEVMRLLVRRPGLSVGEVAGELGLHGPNASAAVRGLAARGLLERRRDPDDGRIARLHPTRRAIATRDRREDGWATAMADALDDLSPADADALLAAAPALRALAERLAAS
ncbi:MAG TPA: MarR family transcriptional regulator [Baekduia sp.]|uniref:MarR family winged helix-turn-helix transcriptional regulator n=1 Tax=Baekduia sp. TaxID=2600305 RepID=UPI002D78A8D7|nr:MarR family transcriptional regulator [Baekduia sp.]HET6506105.1 MarR family transcriptional regulator [Baekduia sp.]